MIIYLFLREGERERQGGREYASTGTLRTGRERRHRIPSRLRTVSAEPDEGLELVNHEIMT